VGTWCQRSACAHTPLGHCVGAAPSPVAALSHLPLGQRPLLWPWPPSEEGSWDDEADGSELLDGARRVWEVCSSLGSPGWVSPGAGTSLSLIPFAAPNPCEANGGKGPCSHLCLINYNRTLSCACPHLMKLDKDNMTCYGRGLCRPPRGRENQWALQSQLCRPD